MTITPCTGQAERTAAHIAALELRIYVLECCDTVNAYQEACRLRRKVADLKAAASYGEQRGR